jgi:hypothetical protein
MKIVHRKIVRKRKLNSTKNAEALKVEMLKRWNVKTGRATGPETFQRNLTAG